MMRLAISVALVLVGGCAGIRQAVDLDPGADFTKFVRYEWAADAENIEPTEFDLRVQAEFDGLLRERGYRKVRANPDFLVHFHAGPLGIDFQRAYRRLRYRPSLGMPVNLDGRPHGADELILDVIDRRSRELVWRGVATRAFDPDDEDRLFVRMALAAEVIMRDFPPRP